MTPEEITTAARRIALSGIQDRIDDWSGIGERLKDQLGDANETEQIEAMDEVHGELCAIRDALCARWES